MKKIKSKSGKSNVHFLQLDLASLDSVRDFSKKFHELESQLHILINNAGVMACAKSTTQDGLEMQIGTNHLGHFLLTNLLLDLLKAASPSRVIVVSALAHKWGSIDKDDFPMSTNYSRFKAYSQSKLANNLFSYELSKKLDGTGVTVNSLHPGIVVSNLIRHLCGHGMIRKVIDPIASSFLNTPEEGSQTSIFLAVDPEVEKVSGKYFTNCQQSESSADSKNDELSAWLWKRSEELVGFNA